MSEQPQKRHFELKDEKSAKFWEVSLEGVTVSVRYGKIGATGQIQSKSFGDAAAARSHADKLVAEKTGKGYVESGRVVQPESTTAAESQPRAPSLPAKKAAGRKPAVLNPAKDPETSPEALRRLLGQDDATSRLLAAHPKADAQLLEELSHSSDKATRRSVCLNANAGKEVLLRLAPQFPGDFFKNPGFDWMLLEDPDLLFKLGQGVLKNILKRPDCPLSFLQWAATHGSEQEQLAVAMNPSASVEVIARLRKKKGAVQTAAVGRSDAGGDVDLEKTFRDEVGQALASLDRDDVRSAWKRGLLGPAQWPQLNASSRAWVLGLDTTVFAVGALPEVAERLSVLADPQPRAVVARHQATAPEILSRLATDKNFEVRAAVARNPACPADLMSLLASDRVTEVRAAVARNPACPADLMSSLARDPIVEVRGALAAHRKVTQDLLERLAKDEIKRVRDGASAVLKVRLKQPATHPGTPAEQLTLLAASKTGTVRCAVAGNPGTPDAALRYLASNANTAIWQEIAGNPGAADDLRGIAYGHCVAAAAPAKLLDHVLDPDCPPAHRLLAAARLWRHRQPWDDKSQDPEQRKALRALGSVVSNMDDTTLVEAFLRDCVDFWLNPSDSRFGRACGRLELTNIAAEQVEACAASKMRALRLIGLAHRKTAPELLAKRSKSTDWVERLAIARNPSVPPNLLAALNRDPHSLVARQAQVTEKFKAEDRSTQDELLAYLSPSIDLGELVQLVCKRLPNACPGRFPAHRGGRPCQSAQNWVSEMVFETR